MLWILVLVGGQIIVRRICNSFGEGAKKWRTFFPAHWETKRDGDEVVRCLIWRQDDRQLQ